MNNGQSTSAATSARGVTRCTPPVSDDQLRTLVGAVRAACAPDSDELDGTQLMVTRAIAQALTGDDIDPSSVAPVSPQQLAAALADFDDQFRVRAVQWLSLVALLLDPVPDEVINNVVEYANALDAGHVCDVVTQRAHGTTAQAALYDFSRNGYATEFTELGDQHVLHADGDDLGDGWAVVTDSSLAQRWAHLADCAPGTLGHAVHEFYMARRFSAPGNGDGSTPPLLAQHDWVHVLANFGTAVECELEVFGFIAASDDDPRSFALLAMVIGLFATGTVDHAATIFEADPGHLHTMSMATRLADAIRRGLCVSRPDGSRTGGLLATDWFEYKDLSVDEARTSFHVPPKSPDAIAAGSPGVWDEDGLSEYQLAHCDLDEIKKMRAATS